MIMSRLRRALMYVPMGPAGGADRKLAKAALLSVDCVCLDLEDGIADSQRPLARQGVTRALDSTQFKQHTERLVRISAVGSGREYLDLESALASSFDGIVIPKVEDPTHIEMVAEKLASTGRHNNAHIIAQIETTGGVANIRQIVSARAPLSGLIFGAEDYSNDVGATRSVHGHELMYARGAVVCHAKWRQLQVFDMVHTNFRDLDGLAAEVQEGKSMGFTGKQVIHPDQVPIVQSGFAPSPLEIDWAQRVVDAWAVNKKKGVGAWDFEGHMVDLPVIKKAEMILAQADLIK